MIVALPPPAAVTPPFWSTDAIALFELDHVTVLSVASSGKTVATSVSLSPFFNASDALFKFTDATSMTFFCTVTVHDAVLFPALAMTYAIPSFIARISPSVTLTVEGSELSQVTVLSVAFSGRTVATSVVPDPSTKVTDVLSKVTLSTGITFFDTVTLHAALFPSAEAVMTANPSVTAVTTPSVTVAIVSSEVLQVTVFSFAFSGSTVAFSSLDSPSTKVNSFGSMTTSVTCTTGLPACVTVNPRFSVSHRMENSALLASSPSLARADIVMVTSPGSPLEGSTESQEEDLVSVILVLHFFDAVN